MTNDYYNKNADKFINDTFDVDMSMICDKFLGYITTGKKILDVGCGSGRDSLYFKGCGYDVVAIDASIELCLRASAVINQEVILLDMNDISFVDEFDGVFACASILHVGSDDLFNVFERLYDALKVGGVLYCSFKYGDDEDVIGGRFFNFMTEGKLAPYVVRFCVLESFITTEVRADGDVCWLNVFLKK
jgi:cyclopropane fatty-acyl-phospholipid synthase-like methyltransferase